MTGMIINTICAFSDSRVSQCYFFALWQLQPMFCWCNSKFYVAFDFDVWETIRNWIEVRRTQFMRILWVNLSTVWPRKPWQGWRKAATIQKESSPSTNFQLLLSFATSRCFGAAPCVARIISSLTSFIRFVNWQLFKLNWNRIWNILCRLSRERRWHCWPKSSLSSQPFRGCSG